MELKKQNCIICTTKVFDSDPVSVNKHVLQIFEFLLETIDTSALQNGLICTTCTEKIQEAVNFKTMHLLKQKSENIEMQQESACKEKYIKCYICKSATKRVSLRSLFSPCYENVVNYMIRKVDLDNLVDPQICDGCQTSALNFHSTLLFLSVYDLNKRNIEQLKAEMITEENKFKIEIVDNCLPDVIKEEVEESEEDFQQKPEMNLKIACEAGSSSAGTLDVKEENNSGNLTANTNDSNWTASIIKTEMNYKNFSILNNENVYENENLNQIEKMYKSGLQTKCSNDLYQHIIVHKTLNDIDMLQSETKYNCYIQKHEVVHKNINKDKMFKCQNCQYQSKYKSNLQRHMLIHKDITEIELFKCQSCQFKTKHKISLKQHMLIHKDTDEIEMFKCQNCQYRTKIKSHLNAHVLIHKDTNEVELFKCPNCQYQTKHKSYLKKHLLIHNNTNEVTVFKCQNCPFQTKQKKCLNQHMIVHKDVNDIEMFKCHNCQFQTKYKVSLKQHMLIHTDSNQIELFKCQNCQYQAKQKVNLNRHMLIHKSANEIELFKCQNCTFQTKRKLSLQRHMLIHKNK